MKIKYKILLLSLLLFVSAIFVTGYSVKVRVEENTEAMIIERLEDQIKLIEGTIDQLLSEGYAEDEIVHILRNMFYDDSEYPGNLKLDMAGTGFIFIMDSTGNNIVHPAFEGENLIDSSAGFKVIHEKKNGLDIYQSPKNNKWKITVFTTNNPLNWTISATAFRDDIIGTKVTDVMTGIVIYSIPGLIIYVILMILVINRQLKPLDKLIENFKRGAEGDLTMTCTIKSKDEIGQLAQAFNSFMEHLRQLLTDVNQASEHIGEKSSVMEVSIKNTITGSSREKGLVHLSDSLNVTKDKIDKQVESTTLMVNEIDQVKESSNLNQKEALKIQDENTKMIDQFNSGINELNALSNKVSTVVVKVSENDSVIQALNQYSSEINGIIETIENIAQETNLLALNASIEAARAGEHGKGFAVVATEIKKLSESTNTETQKISQLIDGIRNEITNVDKTNSLLLDEVNTMSDISKRTTQDISDSKASLEDTNNLVQGMVKLLERQNTATDLLFTQLRDINTESESIRTISEESYSNLKDLENILNENSNIASDLEKTIESLSHELKNFKI